MVELKDDLGGFLWDMTPLPAGEVGYTKEQAAEMVAQMNDEIYWTGWYAVNSNNTHIQWTAATFEGQNEKKANRARKDLTML